MAVTILLNVFVVPLIAYADESSVTVINSVTTASDTGGTSHTSVKTVINGDVVEDVMVNESGTYESTIHSDGVTTSIKTTSGEAHGRDAELLTLIEKLKVLLAYYVSLLSTK